MDFIRLSELKNDFSSAVEEAADKNFLIENELREINNFVNYNPIPKNGKKGMFRKLYPAPQSTGVFGLNIDQYQRTNFTQAFNAFIKTGEHKLEKNYHEPEEAFLIRKNVSEQAKEFYNYYRWLNELKTNPKTSDNSSTKLGGLTNRQKVLALHYLGLQFKDQDYSQTARLLEPILNIQWGDSRKYVRILHHQDEKMMNRENLKAVLHLFEKENFTDQAKKIRVDLENLN